jgi:hypothetical protein
VSPGQRWNWLVFQAVAIVAGIVFGVRLFYSIST